MVLNQAQDSKKSLENNAHILEWRHLYHLNCDRLVYMHHTPNLLAKNQKIEFHLMMIWELDLRIQKKNQPYLPAY